MARPRKYADPISIPFTFGAKATIVELAETYDVAQADVVRMAVDGGGLEDVAQRLAAGERP